MTGKELEHRLDEVYITANKNTVPNEQRSPFITSGLRLGTPAVTTRGLNTWPIWTKLRSASHLAINDFDNNAEKIRGMVTEICDALSALCVRKSKPELIQGKSAHCHLYLYSAGFAE